MRRGRAVGQLAGYLVTLLLSSCAFTDVQVTIPTTVGTGLSGGDNRQVVVIVPFVDDRPTRDRCGIQKNGYNMETARALCSTDPARALAQLLAQELKSAGFLVVTEGVPANAGAVRLQGSLVQFFVEPVIGFTTVSLEDDVQIKLVATSETGLLAERTFFVKGTASGLAATAGNFQTSVDNATRQIVKDMVAAVINLMNRYPQLGLRPGGVRLARIARVHGG